MAGEREGYELLSYFFSLVFDLNVNAVGRPAQADQTVVWGEPGDGPCVAFGACAGRLCGIVLIDAPAELEAARTLVRTRAPLAILGESQERDTLSLAGLVERVGEYRDSRTGQETE
jgi:hypothetical protein